MHEVSFCAITQTRHCIQSGWRHGRHSLLQDILLLVVASDYQWLSMVTDGYQWLSMVRDGRGSVSMVTDGYQWLSMVRDGTEAAYPWLLMAISGMVQRRRIHGY